MLRLRIVVVPAGIPVENRNGIERILGQFRTLLDSEERDAGRALDFLLQEMHREANTLSVKARFDNLMPIVLQLRTGIERLREQARNIE